MIDREKIKERFLNKILIPVDPTKCWIWIGRKHRDGYGSFYLNSRPYQAYRMSYELFVGDIPIGLHVLHNCDNRICVNFTHLRLGTHQENVRDMMDKDRHAKPVGKLNPASKLTDSQILAIRIDPRSNRKISIEYSISHQQVSRIKNKKQWRHLPS